MVEKKARQSGFHSTRTQFVTLGKGWAISGHLSSAAQLYDFMRRFPGPLLLYAIPVKAWFDGTPSD